MKESLGAFEANRTKREAAKEKILETAEKLRSEYKIETKFIETPDTVTLEVENGDGTTTSFGFMKSEKVIVGNNRMPIQDVVEAKLRFPNLDITDALEKIKKENLK